jgi:hypothetical protein
MLWSPAVQSAVDGACERAREMRHWSNGALDSLDAFFLSRKYDLTSEHDVRKALSEPVVAAVRFERDHFRYTPLTAVCSRLWPDEFGLWLNGGHTPQQCIEVYNALRRYDLPVKPAQIEHATTKEKPSSSMPVFLFYER